MHSQAHRDSVEWGGRRTAVDPPPVARPLPSPLGDADQRVPQKSVGEPLRLPKGLASLTPVKPIITLAATPSRAPGTTKQSGATSRAGSARVMAGLMCSREEPSWRATARSVVVYVNDDGPQLEQLRNLVAELDARPGYDR